MREKMARAMYESQDNLDLKPSWDNTGEMTKGIWFREADAALDALMEPTEAMKQAGTGYLRLAGYAGTDPDGVAEFTMARMIRAAREGK